MHIKVDLTPFKFTGERRFFLPEVPTKIEDLYKDKDEYKELLEEYQEEIYDLQSMMYAHDRYAMLLIFQAMDAAGKDGTIKHVMSGVNPHGLQIFSFKQPSNNELDHDFMWRTTRCFPERGRIGIFNRSYYEEVLVVKVHPEILLNYQRIPQEHLHEVDMVFQQRYQDICNLELYAYRNGIRVVKFFLNLSKEEQAERFLARIETPSKNWKFSEGDVKERAYWDNYMEAYETCINATATHYAPWYVIPADDKKNMRIIVSEAVLHELRMLDIHYPKVDEARRKELMKYKEMLESE